MFMEKAPRAKKGDGCARLVALVLVLGVLWWLEQAMGPWRFLVVAILFVWAAVLIGRLMFVANGVTNEAEAREKDTRK